MYATDFTQVGDNIYKKLVENNMTQQELADNLGISKQVMNKIIKGNKAINVNEISKIAETLQTTTDELLTITSDSLMVDDMSFMGAIQDHETKEKIDIIRNAIDEILMLEELLDNE